MISFLADPDQWYKKNKIPKESVDRARTKAARIRQTFLYQEDVEVFGQANPRLNESPK